jgi:hypothetical protein
MIGPTSTVWGKKRTFFLRTETNFSLRNIGFQLELVRGIIFKKFIIIIGLVHDRHKPSGLIYN